MKTMEACLCYILYNQIIKFSVEIQMHVNNTGQYSVLYVLNHHNLSLSQLLQ